MKHATLLALLSAGLLACGGSSDTTPTAGCTVNLGGAVEGSYTCQVYVTHSVSTDEYGVHVGFAPSEQGVVHGFSFDADLGAGEPTAQTYDSINVVSAATGLTTTAFLGYAQTYGTTTEPTGDFTLKLTQVGENIGKVDGQILFTIHGSVDSTLVQTGTQVQKQVTAHITF